MIFNTFLIAMMLCALSPMVLFCVNLRRYRTPAPKGTMVLPRISILVPARNEEKSIHAAVTSALSSVGVEFEIVVMDDGSVDRTAAIVSAIGIKDRRVRLEHAPPLPTGWNGKQHACWALAEASRFDLLCFLDADVRVEPEALARMAAFLARKDAALVSGFPRQETGSWMEWLLLPLIHFVLLGFLPIDKMRKGTDPSFAAGCGQFMMVRREAYFAAGGHAKIRQTMHDGLLLPKLLRQSAYRTDIADITGLATCRMYQNASQVVKGLGKNATEGIATPVRILPISLLLVMGQIMPYCMGIWLLGRRGTSTPVIIYVLVAMAGAWLPRILAVKRFHQDWRGALLHPIGIAVLVAVQWYSLTRKLMGGEVSWKERSYAGN